MVYLRGNNQLIVVINGVNNIVLKIFVNYDIYVKNKIHLAPFVNNY